MTWNYRVIRRTDPSGGPDQFAIHEVYYDSSGQIEMWTEEPCDPFGESLSELKADVKAMSAALSKPILHEADLLEGLAHRATEPPGDRNADEENARSSGD
jgi:hypothetical protein